MASRAATLLSLITLLFTPREAPGPQPAPYTALGPETLRVTVRKPVVIANLALTQSELAADSSEGLSEVVSDFDTYLLPIRDSLLAQGVELKSTNARVIIVLVGGSSYTFAFSRDSTLVGYILAAPKRVPKLLAGVRTDFDLPRDVRLYLK